MRNLRILILALAVLCPIALSAASDLVGPTIIHNLPAKFVLTVYEQISGKKIAATSEVQAIKAIMTVKIEKKSKEEVLRLIERSLAEQAGIEIVHEVSGDLTARKLVTRK